MKPSTELAEEHFHTKVLPRRILDRIELVQYAGVATQRKKYRKATRDETGELYPYFQWSVSSMAQFGLGVSVYLLQLVIIGAISFLAGVIMIPAIKSYNSEHEEKFTDLRIAASAACTVPISVNATIDCKDNQVTCSADLRENCPIYQSAIICDITMSIFLLIIFYFNMGIDRVEDRMDEVVQTAQDYSIVVRDPCPDAYDPDEFYDFFSRFGRVKNITVTKENKSIVRLLLKKHLILRRIDPRLHDKIRDIVIKDEKLKKNCCIRILQSFGFFLDEQYWMNALVDVNKLLNEAYKKVCPVCRVYVSFETESEQRLCLKELSVSMLQSMYNQRGRDRIMFRGTEVLSVLESAEPNNILWDNLENKFIERMLRQIGAWIFSLIVMAISFYFIQLTYDTHSTLVPIVIGLIDTFLPTIFFYITVFECHIDEDDQQNSLMFKLYGARLLTSVFFTYYNTDWSVFLNDTQVTNILNIQLSASFVSPLIKALDLYGVTMRWIVSPLVSTTQQEMNQYWEGTSFTLADRYTELAKILFISLFYSFITPLGLFVSTIACIVLFAVDRYLLFRKTKPPPLLDASMASSMRNYLLFAVAVHMYVTARFIYSWPFDSATYSSEENTYTYINKEAPYLIWKIKPQPWHSDTQRHYLILYKWIAVAIILSMLYVLVLEPFKDFLVAFFYSETKIETSASSSKPYSSVGGIVAYCPMIYHGTEKFLVADTRLMLPRHKPETITSIPNEDPNLGNLVPEYKRKDILAVVKWYPHDDESKVVEEQKVDANVIASVLKTSLLSSPSKLLTNEQEKIMITPYVSMTPTSHDVIRIDIETPIENNGLPPPQSALELIAQRELEGSRIKRSIARQKLKKSASVTPIVESNQSAVSTLPQQNSTPDESISFTREEVYLLRQIRKEFISLKISDIIPTNRSGEENKMLYFVTFEEYLNILKQYAPEGLKRISQTSGVKNINDVIKLNRGLLRKIFIKFTLLQEKVNESNLNENKLNFEVFLLFIQNGMVLSLSNNEENKKNVNNK